MYHVQPTTFDLQTSDYSHPMTLKTDRMLSQPKQTLDEVAPDSRADQILVSNYLHLRRHKLTLWPATPDLNRKQTQPDTETSVIREAEEPIVKQEETSYSQLRPSQLPPRHKEPDFSDTARQPLTMATMLDGLDRQKGINASFRTRGTRRAEILTWFTDNGIEPYNLASMTEQQWQESPLNANETALLRSCALGLLLAWSTIPPWDISGQTFTRLDCTSTTDMSLD